MSVTKLHLRRDILILRLHIMISKALGLVPFTINIVSRIRRNTTRITLDCTYSTVGSVYNGMLSFVLIFLTYYVANTVIDRSDSGVVAMEYQWELMLLISGNTCCVIILLINCFRQRKLVRLANRYFRWEIGLIKVRPDSYLPKKHFLHTLLFMTYTIINVMVSTMEILTAIDNEESISLNVVPGVILGFLIIQYSIVLSSIQTGFHRLNKLLKLMVKPFSVHHFDVVSIVQNAMPDNLTVENFFVIKRAHRALGEILFDFSLFYTWSITCAISFIYVELIYSAYHFVMPFVRSVWNPLLIITSLFWIVRNIFVLVALTGCAMRTAAELNRTRAIVHKIIDNCTTCMGLKYELELFASELLEKNVSFVAYGLISLDGNLLKSMLSTMITYMIILVQYDQQIRNTKSVTDVYTRENLSKNYLSNHAIGG